MRHLHSCLYSISLILYKYSKKVTQFINTQVFYIICYVYKHWVLYTKVIHKKVFVVGYYIHKFSIILMQRINDSLFYISCFSYKYSVKFYKAVEKRYKECLLHYLIITTCDYVERGTAFVVADFKKNYKERRVYAAVSMFFLCFSSVFFVELHADIVDLNSINAINVSFMYTSESQVQKDYMLNFGTVDVPRVYTFGVEQQIPLIEASVIDFSDSLTTYVYQEEYRVGKYLASRDVTETIGSINESQFEKHFRLFGNDAVSKYGRVEYYEGGEIEAESNMTSFKVQVWDLDSNGEWFKRNFWIETHKNLKSTVLCIFSDLLQLPEDERTPIKDLGCYHYRYGSSCHTCGAAFDVNSRENAEMTITGVITAGEYWKPYEDIYSITPESKIVEIFAKYGYSWGGDWTSKKDYMHFSYLDR